MTGVGAPTDEFRPPLPLPLYRDDERVRVLDSDREWPGEYGTVENWYYGMAGSVMYVVKLDVRRDPWVFHQAELERAR